MRRFLFVRAACAFVFSACVLSLYALQPQPPLLKDSDTLVPITGLKKGVLPNGFTYYILPNGYPKEKLELRLVWNVGSLHEDDDQRGLAHVLEHMCFNGTKSFPKNDIVKYLQTIGVRFGADLNAYTNFDKTVYILPVPTKNPDHVRTAFKIMGEWARSVSLFSEDVEQEKPVVLAESTLSKGAYANLRDTLIGLLSPAYARRFPIGLDSVVRNFHPDVLRRFYRDWYRPDLCAIVVVGDIDPAVAERYIMQAFASWQPQDNPRQFHVPVPASLPPSVAQQYVDAELPLGLAFLYSHTAVPTQPVVTLHDYRRGVIRNLINEILHRRLKELASSPAAPFVDASVSTTSYEKGYSRFNTLLVLSPSGVDSAMKAFVSVMKQATHYGFSTREIADASKDLLAILDNRVKQKAQYPSERYAQQIISAFLDGHVVLGPEQSLEYTKLLIPTIHPEDLRAELRRFCNDSNFAVVMALPPSQQNLLRKNAGDLVTAVQHAWRDVAVAPRVEEQDNKPLVPQLPSLGKIVSTKQSADFQTTDFVLSNGVRVLLKPTKYKEDQVLVRLFARGGSFNLPADQQIAADLLPILMNSMGLGAFSEVDLERVLSGKNVRTGLFLNELSHGISGSSTVGDLKTLFELFYLHLCHPRFDKALFDNAIVRLRTSVASAMNDPVSAFQEDLSRFLFANHPYRKVDVLTEQQISSVSYDALQHIYKELYTNIAAPVLVVVGNLTEQKLRPLLEQYIASVPLQNKKPLTFVDVKLRPKGDDQKFVLRKGKDKKAFLEYFFHLPFAYSEKNALHAGLLSQMLEMYFIEQIREKKSWVYAIGLNGSCAKYPYERAYFVVDVPCSPTNIDSVDNAVGVYLQKFVQSPSWLSSHLERVKKQNLESLRIRKETNEFWLSSLQEHELYGYNADFYNKREQWIQQTTLADLHTIGAALFQNKNRVKAYLYPAVK